MSFLVSYCFSFPVFLLLREIWDFVTANWVKCFFKLINWFDNFPIIYNMLLTNFIHCYFSSISPWWGSKSVEGVSYSIERFKWHYSELWPSQYFTRRKNTSSYSWSTVAVVMCWNREDTRYSCQGTWWYMFYQICPSLFRFNLSFFRLVLFRFNQICQGTWVSIIFGELLFLL